MRLEFLDHLPGRMIALRQLDRRIGHVAAAAIIAACAFGADTNPGMELGERDRRGAPARTSFHISSASRATSRRHSHDQLVLRAEVTIECHLVGARSFRDGIDADAADPYLRNRSRAVLMMRSRGFSRAGRNPPWVPFPRVCTKKLLPGT